MTKKSVTLDVDPLILEKTMRIVQNNPMEEEINKLFSGVDPHPSKLVKPTPGFCVKTFTKPDNKKVFINVCLTDAIPCPRDITNGELMQILSSEDPSSYRVPMSIGEGRTEQDKSGAPATVYDIAINPNFFKKLQEDDLFQTFFLTVVFEGLQDKYQTELDIQKFVVLKNRHSIGKLQSHRIQIRDVKNYEEITKSRLIEEIGEEPAPKELDSVPFRLRREPRTGIIEFLVAEFKIPPTVSLSELRLEAGEDRVVLAARGRALADAFLPADVDQLASRACLDRNTDMLTVKMPVIH